MGSNPINASYSWRYIANISLWVDFYYNTVIQRYGNELIANKLFLILCRHAHLGLEGIIEFSLTVQRVYTTSSLPSLSRRV